MRNAVNTFFYRDPDTLPTRAPATALSSEPHSFSRVFTGAFFEGLAGMLATTDTKDEAALLKVSQDIGVILVEGIRAASVVPTFFSQVAASMLGVAASTILRVRAMRRRSEADSCGTACCRRRWRWRRRMYPSAQRALAASPAAKSKTLPTLRLSVAEYGLGVPSIVVYAAAEPKRLQVAGAALAVGAAPSPGEDQAAKSFFEDLLRRGRLKIAPRRKYSCRGRAGRSAPHDPRNAHS